MIKYYHGTGKHGPYFEGWYLNHQTKQGSALALIPAIHIDRLGRRNASLQVIADNQTWWLEYPDTAFCASEQAFRIQMGKSLFTSRAIRLNVERNGFSLCGTLRYGQFTPLKSDIMGPFRFLPGMECSHGVISMGHSLEGTLVLNGKKLDFSGGTGYIETDRGRSFPSAYLWTQCIWQEPHGGSLMLSVATIPIAAVSFTGCICAIVCDGQEYRLTTYRGARVKQWSDTGVEICQGKYRLKAELLEENRCPLRAPVEGNMERTIHESLCANVRYRFWRRETLLFDHTNCRASFEYADERNHHGQSTT